MTDETLEATDVPVVCDDCETTTRVALSELAETLERHNEQVHDGEDVAAVDPDVADHLLDMIAGDLLAEE